MGIGIDGEQPIRAAPDERERLEPPISDEQVLQNRLGERVQLSGLVIEGGLPQEAQAVLVDFCLRQARVAPDPASALRVEPARGPVGGGRARALG